MRDPAAWAGLFHEVTTEFMRAHTKHAGYTPAHPDMDNRDRLVILVEEIGEVSRALTYDNGDPAQLREELIQTATMALAWVAGLDGQNDRISPLNPPSVER